MGKLQNVTADELKELDDSTFDACQKMHGIAGRIEKGYCDQISDPATLARSFLSLSRAAADVAALLLGKAAMQELQRETEAMLRDRKPSPGPTP